MTTYRGGRRTNWNRGFYMNLKRFSAVNLERCTSPQGFGHNLESWSAAEWTNAVGGELGEAQNLTKKLLRHRDNVAGNHKPEDLDIESLKRRAAKELCDAIIYCDLSIQALGFDTSATLVQVFNDKSEELSCPIRYGDSSSFIYLAGPYAHPDPEVREMRYRALTAVAANMMRNGVPVYSPITHNHPLATMNEMPTGWDFWRSMDEPMITQSSELHVLMLDGWKESVGVTAEIAIAERLGKPVRYISKRHARS